MSGQPSAGTRRGLLLDSLIFGVGGAIFLLAGLFSNFYTSSSIEILIVVQTGLMAAYGVLAFKTAKDEADTKNLIDQSIRLGFVYSVGVALMLVNAKVTVYSLEIYTAPIGYFVCIASYLGFAAYYVQMKHSLKVNIAKSIGFVLLVGVVAISLVLERSGLIRFALNLADIWLWIAAAIIGFSVYLIASGTPTRLAQRIPKELPKPLGEVEATKFESPRYVESGTPIIPKYGEPIILTSKLLAGMDFYPSRKELQAQAPIEDVIESARSSVDLLGFTAESWAVGLKDTIRKSLKDGKHFRFIILSPASKSIKEADDLNQGTDLQGRISESLRMLQTIKSELSDVERGRLDIRIHDLLPIHSIVAIDAESERGVIYVEYYVYGTDCRSWVTLSISKKEQGALFDRFWQSYKYVWERSKTWP